MPDPVESARGRVTALTRLSRTLAEVDKQSAVALGRRIAGPPVRSLRRRWRRAKRTVAPLLEYRGIRSFYRDMDKAEVDAAIAACRGKDALLITVAFNRPDLIELQSRSLRAHFTDSYQLVVVDNSPKAELREQIRRVCLNSGASYISLPRNPAKNGGDSHGLALNWAQRNLVAHAGTLYVGHLDHDIFALRDVSYSETIRTQKVYGHFQNWSGYKFFWPGLCFFASNFFDPERSDFRPKWFGDVYADTGAGNWLLYYSKMDVEGVKCFELKDVWADDITREFDKKGSGRSQQEAAFTLFDQDWVHLVNGSNWANVEMEGKIDRLRALLAIASDDSPGRG